MAGGVAAGLLCAAAASAGTVTVGDYAALTNAIAVCADGDTISLANSITVSAQCSISAKGLTFEGNQHTVSVPVPSLDGAGFVNANASAFRVFNVTSVGKTNTIRNMTVKGGIPSGEGGGIVNCNGTLVLESVAITQSGGSSYGGGGVANESGTLFMRGCTISLNTAANGGGFINLGEGAKMFLERCTLKENRCMSGWGGGAGENKAALYVNNSTFANNESVELGGAINNYGGTSFFVGCTFVGNMAYGVQRGGAIAHNNGAVTLVNSLFAYNYHNSSGTYVLDDIYNYIGTAPLAYGCVFQSTTNQMGVGSVGTTLYAGNATGSDDALFTGGASTRVRAADGTEMGAATFYLPFLTRAGSSPTPTALLKSGSFASHKGVRAAFSSATAIPVVGYYNGSAWVALSGDDPASHEVTTDQNGYARSGSQTAGAVVEDLPSAPVITTPPTSQTVAVGGTLTVGVTATGVAPVHYQWFKNNGMLSGATNSTLVRTGAAVTDSGVYTVAITNAFGMRISTPFTVTVGNPQLLAWGYNCLGQLGDGTRSSRSNAVPVASHVVAAGGGIYHSLFVKGDGTLCAMGQNAYGQLGDGTLNARSNAVPVAGNVVAAAAGCYHSLFLKNDGTLWAMGYNAYGQLGDGALGTRSNAVPVASNVVAAAAGAWHSLFLKADSTLWAMGKNTYGPLGDGTTNNRSRAVCMASNVVSVAAGDSHSLFLKGDGTLWAMGQNTSGQLGDGTLSARSNAVLVASNVVAAAAGAWHSLYVKGDGTLWGMGRNDDGQLGDGTRTARSSPVPVASNVTALTAGNLHSLYVKGDGTLWAMGYNGEGELGDGTISSPRLRPVPVTGMSLAAVFSGSVAYHTLAVGVTLPPLITRQPVAQTAGLSSNVTFCVAAGGFMPLAYQWYFNDVAISGATATNYTLAGVSATHAGNYTVVVSNPGGSVTSSVAALTFNKASASVTLDGLIQTCDGAPKSVTAFTVPSGLTVLMTYNGFDTAPTAAGSYAVTGTVSDANWQGSASGTMIVKAAQSITFAAIPPQPLVRDGAFVLAATASSGLPVTFSVLSGPGMVVPMTDNTYLWLGAAGTVVVVASQAGNDVYDAAPDVTNRVAVYAVSPASGPLAGGNTVTLSIGTLGTVTGVRVGGVAVAVHGSDTNMTLTLPATGSAGIKDIVIQTSDNGDFTLTGAYTVNPAGSIGSSRLDPIGWEGFGSGLSGNSVTALAMLDGVSLYAGGDFTMASGVAANHVALWNGTVWTNLGSGLSGTAVYALAYDGANLYAGGDFTNAGGVVANSVAMWNGTSWTNLGSGMDGTVRALMLVGANLYAGGTFTTAGGVAANSVAMWNGTCWTNLGSGVDSSVRAFARDHNHLYVGGAFTTAGGVAANHVALWNGTAWTNLGSGVDGTVRALTIVGTSVVAGGDFTTAGDKEANAVAQWNGASWEALGSGMNDSVTALAQDGVNLYAGGYFTSANGVGANYVAMWDGTGWTALGSGMSSAVKALAYTWFNHLVAGGDFTAAGGKAVNRVAAWGATLVTLSGVEPASGALAGGYTVTISGADLCNGSDVTGVTLCGVEASIQSQSAAQIVVTAGAAASIGPGDVRVYSTRFGETVKTNAFTYLANQTVSVAAIAPQPRAATVVLTATASSGLPVSFRVVSGPGSIADKTNLTFSAAGLVEVAASQAGDAVYGAAPDVHFWMIVYTVIPDNGPFMGANSVAINSDYLGLITNVVVGSARATMQGTNANGLTLAMPATGSAGLKDILVQTSTAGDFTLAGAYTVNPAGQIGGSVTGPNVWTALGGDLPGSAVYALASVGTNLFAGGTFTIASGAPVHDAQTEGMKWSDLGTGLDDAVTALAYDGVNLYAGGYFTTAGGVAVNGVAMWNGTYWSSLGSGMDGPVSALVCDRGNLYAGGAFTTAGGYPASRIAMWNGTCWTGLGSGMLGSSVTALAHDGTNLYAGGEFTKAGGVAASRVARWDGSRWWNLGSGMNGKVFALECHEAGLVAGGEFTSAGGKSASRVAQWDGAEWTSLGSGMNDTVRALTLYGAHLYAGGYFTAAGGIAANYVAMWNGTGWSSLDSGVNSWVRALAHDETHLYVGGVLSTNGNLAATTVAMWQPTVITYANVTPASGSEAGGYLVAISGPNLGDGADVTSVTLCGISAEVQSQSATQIVVKAGMSASLGRGDVRVFSTRFGETVKADAFTYLGSPVWDPQVLGGESFGVRSNQFVFTVTGSSNLVVVVEACTNLATPVWAPVKTNTLVKGLFTFTDPDWTNYPTRFYRLRQP
jgi:alpha-tubulin suppressor-like RCC1 family protein